MAHVMEPEKSEVEDQIDKAEKTAHTRSRWPGMSYEQGVSQALRWVLGETDEPPMDGDD